MKLFFIRLLLWLLKVPVHKIDEERLKRFFWTVYPQQGFQDYVSKRNFNLLQEMGKGVTPDEYRGLLYQRIELGLLLTIAKRSFEQVEKERSGKEATAQRRIRKAAKPSEN